MDAATHRAVIALPRPGEPSAVVIEHVDPGQRVRLSGRVDAHTVADVRTALREAIDHGHGALYVEAAGVEMGDTTGLGALLGAHRRSQRSSRSLVLVDVPQALDRLLAATRLDRVLRTEAGHPAAQPVSA